MLCRGMSTLQFCVCPSILDPFPYLHALMLTLCQQQPGNEDEREPEKHFGQELLFYVLRSSTGCRTGSRLAEIESRCEKPEGECSDTKGHMESRLPKPKT